MSAKTTVDNIYIEMAEIDDYATLSDALGANNINSHYVTREQLISLIDDIRSDGRLYIAKAQPYIGTAPFYEDKSSAELADYIFADEIPVAAMMEMVLLESQP